MKTELKIEGLSCGHCVNAVETLLKSIKGVRSTEVSLPNNAKVAFDENVVSIEQLKQAINNSDAYKIV